MGLIGGSDIDGGQNCKDKGLDLADQQFQQLHDNGKKQRHHGQQNGPQHGAAHDVAEEAHRQGQGAGEFGHQVKRQHEDRGFKVVAQVGPKPLVG